MERPTHIDLSAPSSRAASSTGTSRNGQPSPRIQHFDGDVPPTLSPLDAFAAESRRLAKELNATRVVGDRRISRLPPQVITKSLSQHQANRPACFRSLSSTTTDPVPTLQTREDAHTVRISPEIKVPSQRPKSSYPLISAAVHDEEEQQFDRFQTPLEYPPPLQSYDYFHIERTSSPQNLTENPELPSTQSTSASEFSQSQHIAGLVPPTAPFAKGQRYESSDDDYTSSNAGSTFSHTRKLSNGSAISFPVSPALPSQHERSPSDKSDVSTASLTRPKPHLNFSRPMSQMSANLRVDSPTRPMNSVLERKPSHLSDQTRNLSSFEDSRSIMSDGAANTSTTPYTHEKLSLPRGKMSERAAERISQLFDGLSGPTFGWQEPVFPGTPPLTARSFDNNSPTFRSSFDPGRPSLDPGRPRSDNAQASSAHAGFSFGFEQMSQRTNERENRPSSSRTLPEVQTTLEVPAQRPSTSHNANPSSFGRFMMPTLPTIPGSTADDMSMRSSRPQTATEQSASTLRPTTARSISDYQALSAEEHVDKGISLHQNGDLKESTYHLRIAAKLNHPTGMLLYALACRHGWGMRANPAEGVLLLRKAVDMAVMEVADDEDASSPNPKASLPEQKAHRAHFALAIYELGISHLNGWGIEQDKALALRCFEIAGSWGDADALTEAGFCYAQGVGCKKNLKKAAKFYRLAADKGVSMVGNSWIYKEKYNDVKDELDERPRKFSFVSEERAKKPRSKSKSRSIFGRKRAATVGSDKTPSQPKVSTES